MIREVVHGTEGYPAEFRRRALDLVAAGKPVREVALLFEVSDQSIYSWRRKQLIDPGRADRAYLAGAEGAPRGSPADPGARDRAGGAAAGGGAVEGVGTPKRRFEAISVMARDGLPVEVACRVLGVSCAGYYAWRFRPPSARAVRHAWLTDLIREIHTVSYGFRLQRSVLAGDPKLPLIGDASRVGRGGSGRCGLPS